MLNYLKADLCRILTKKSRIIFLAICCAIGLANVFFLGGETPDTAQKAVLHGISFLPLLLGLVEIPALFGDEFKARSMQMAIGHGVSKRKIVHTKWLETFIIGFIDITVISIVVYLFAGVTCSGLFALGFGDVFLTYFITVLEFFFFMGLIMFLLFGTQSSILGIIVFILLNLNLIPSILSIVQSGLGLQKMRLDSLLLSQNLHLLQAQLELGNISISAIITLVVYFVIFFNLSVLVFKNKELDF